MDIAVEVRECCVGVLIEFVIDSLIQQIKQSL